MQSDVFSSVPSEGFRAWFGVALLMCLALIAGCGQKGPLTLPSAAVGTSAAAPASAPATGTR